MGVAWNRTYLMSWSCDQNLVLNPNPHTLEPAFTAAPLHSANMYLVAQTSCTNMQQSRQRPCHAWSSRISSLGENKHGRLFSVSYSEKAIIGTTPFRNAWFDRNVQAWFNGDHLFTKKVEVWYQLWVYLWNGNVWIICFQKFMQKLNTFHSTKIHNFIASVWQEKTKNQKRSVYKTPCTGFLTTPGSRGRSRLTVEQSCTSIPK
jgi:hypothetical protein